MTAKTTPFDASLYLDDPESQAELIADALASGDANYITNALGVVAKARGMTQIAKDAGVTREALYRALSGAGDPKLTTFLGVLKALGLQISIKEATNAVQAAKSGMSAYRNTLRELAK